MRLLIAVVIAGVALASYLFNTTTNPVTGIDQRVAGIGLAQEVQMGLASAPKMAAQFGGPSDNVQGQQLVEEIGRRLVQAIPVVYDEHIDSVSQIPWEFSFTLLDDDETVNAFALPGGPTFVTDALFNRFESEGQLAGVMGHEIGHVIHRHGLERMAQQNLMQGLAGAATTAAGDVSGGQAAAMIGNFLQMSYGREQELQCDREGILLMVEAGYDPRSMVGGDANPRRGVGRQGRARVGLDPSRPRQPHRKDQANHCGTVPRRRAGGPAALTLSGRAYPSARRWLR
jgi:predicted Zn-dependent protease